jgi:integrase
MKTSEVRFWGVRKSQTKKIPSWEIRWVVAGRQRSQSRRTKALAEAFLADLRQAARNGELFESDSGLPESMEPVTGLTWLELAQQYVDTKWSWAAPKSRDAMTDALATITAALVSGRAEPPDSSVTRTALRQHLLPPPGRLHDRPNDIAAVIEWLTRNSLPLAELSKAKMLRRALDAIAVTLDGSPAAATTIRRKRAVFHNALQYAVEIEELQANNLDKVSWRAPKIADVVDRRVVINPKQARELLNAVTYVGPVDRGRHLRGFFACMYYAGLRPAEVQALRLTDCELPDKGWGLINLAESRPEANRRWSDSGDSHERRGLKHRAASGTRRVPIPPELVTILRDHVAEFGTASEGRLFQTRRGGIVGSNYAAIWAAARPLALTPAQVATPLAARPYDLRHAAVSLWLNAGLPATEVAERAGHGVDVLLRVYASCIDGSEPIANVRIDTALGAG